jgi:hypothetical protein
LHAIIGHAALNFPGWSRILADVEEKTPRELCESAKEKIAAGGEEEERNMSQQSYDAHVVAYAKRAVAASMLGLRAFRVLEVPIHDVARDPATRAAVLTGKSREFQEWLEKDCKVKTELRTTEAGTAFPLVGLNVVFR